VMKKKSVVFVIGPTASGKTALAHRLCLQNPKFVPVNIDVFQCYQKLDIGTAKPTPEERLKFSYELVDFLQPWERIDAERFAQLAREVFKKLWSEDKIPICVGGSGLYLNSLLKPMDILPKANDFLRKSLREFAVEWGWPTLHHWLSHWDPERARALHPNDKTRIERALELFLLSGVTFEQLKEENRSRKLETNREDGFASFVLQIRPEIAGLKERIVQRVQQMFDMGWVEEVKNFREDFSDSPLLWQSFQAIGYCELLRFIIGKENEPAVEGIESQQKSAEELQSLSQQIALRTSQYAKRQLTWNAKVTSDRVFSTGQISNDEFDKLVESIESFFDSRDLRD
jgi:tRNA dimethylallyltransferase